MRKDAIEKLRVKIESAGLQVEEGTVSEFDPEAAQHRGRSSEKLTMKIAPTNAESAPQPAGGYSQAVAVSDVQRMLFISGQIPETPTGNVPNDFSSQARLVWRNVLAQLGTADMTAANLIKVTIFLSSREFAASNREIRQQVLGAHSPALTVIITGIFDEKWLLEIEAVAAA